MASSSERRSSISSQHSTHSVPHLSIDKRHSTDKRSSTDSTIRTPLPNIPGLSSLPGISRDSPLAPTGSRGIPPPTPPKDRLPPPQTPTRKPVQRQKSPLSSEAFSSASPALTMPGTFPVTSSSGSPVGLPVTQSSSTAYAGTTSSPAPTTPVPTRQKGSGKRSSSLRDFLPFKALRKNYDQSSPDPSPHNGPPRPSSAFGMRPSTPGAESMMSKSTTPSSVRKKMSGSFWRRKSGLLSFGGEDERASTDTNGAGSVSTSVNDTLVDDDNRRSATPLPGDEESSSGILRVVKRKSATFWRRKSSLDLLDQYNNSNNNNNNSLRGGVPMDTNGAAMKNQTNGHMNGHSNADSDDDVVMSGTGENGATTNGFTTAEMPRPRSTSPPPQLPAFVGGGEGLGLETESMFRDF